jgi:putative transposase
MGEAFWSRMQVELLDRQRWATRSSWANAPIKYLELFHDRQASQRPRHAESLQVEQAFTVA